MTPREPLRPEHRKRFLRLVAQLNHLTLDVAEYMPEVGYYLSGSTLNLMDGESHSLAAEPQLQNVQVSAKLHRSSGGDW